MLVVNLILIALLAFFFAITFVVITFDVNWMLGIGYLVAVVYGVYRLLKYTLSRY